MEISQLNSQILDHNKNAVLLKLMKEAEKYRAIKKCVFTEINDLNNQIMNHKELGSCTEINEFRVKKPQILALCHQLMITPGTLKN
jgi:hypothetical protein